MSWTVSLIITRITETEFPQCKYLYDANWPPLILFARCIQLKTNYYGR